MWIEGQCVSNDYSTTSHILRVRWSGFVDYHMYTSDMNIINPATIHAVT